MFKVISDLLISFAAYTGVCADMETAALLSPRRKGTVLLCGVDESMGQFKTTFFRGCLFFNQQVTAVFQVFPPSTNSSHIQTSSGWRLRCEGNITAWILQQHSRLTGRLLGAEHDF